MRTHVPETGLLEIEANGVRFACIEAGEGPLVLMLHGFPDTAHTWDGMRDAIAADGWRVVTPFTRGYAPTSLAADGDYTLTALARDALALIEALGEERAVLVGHDWGAAAVYGAAALEPERVERLIAIGVPHPNVVTPTPKLVWGARHMIAFQLPGATARFARDDFAAVDALYARWSPSTQWSSERFEHVKNAFAAPGCVDAALDYYRCMRSQPAIPNVKRVLDVPCLLVSGRDDPVITPAIAERSEAMFTDGNFELVLTPGGHFLHLEAPAETLAAVRKFLSA